jgi:hypothetical protein
MATAERLAFGEESGESMIFTHPNWNELASLNPALAIGETKEIVPVTTLDERGVNRIDLLKIDTEGYELPILRGAERMLRRHAIGAVFAEVGFDRDNKRNTYIADLAELLAGFGYSFYGLYDVTHYPRHEQPSFGNALFTGP